MIAPVATATAAVPAGSQYVELGGVVFLLDGDEDGYFLRRLVPSPDALECPAATCGADWEESGGGTVRRTSSNVDSFDVVYQPYGPDGVRAIECSHCGAEFAIQYQPFDGKKV